MGGTGEERTSPGSRGWRVQREIRRGGSRGRTETIQNCSEATERWGGSCMDTGAEGSGEWKIHGAQVHAENPGEEGPGVVRGEE